VFVHGRRNAGAKFAVAYHGGTMDGGGGGVIRADATETSAPIRDGYATGHEAITQRWTAHVTFHFALDAALLRCSPAAFAFTDDSDGERRYPISLAEYR
jgi:hypothetical protein